MTALAFGRTGQVGHALLGTPGIVPINRDEADLSDASAIASLIRECKPSAVINAAAYTAVDQAEAEEETARLVNAVAPGVMAETAKELCIPFLHISTDFVFDGEKEAPYTEADAPNPLSVYGKTKFEGDQRVMEAGGNSVVLRTAWVFSERGRNFIHIMLKLSETLPVMKIVSDQRGSPTSASDIAAVIPRIIARQMEADDVSGIYHYAGAPDVSRVDFAREIFRLSGRSPEIEEVATTEFPTPAPRPLNSTLDCSKLEKVFGIERPDWRKSLAVVLSRLGELKANG